MKKYIVLSIFIVILIIASIEVDEAPKERTSIPILDQALNHMALLCYDKYLIKNTSEFFSKTGYIWWSNTLIVEFSDDKNIYLYYKIAPDTYRELIDAESVSEYYEKNIKEQYESLRIN